MHYLIFFFPPSFPPPFPLPAPSLDIANSLAFRKEQPPKLPSGRSRRQPRSPLRESGVVLKGANMATVPVYCICRLPYDVTRFMIECDACKDWFHGR